MIETRGHARDNAEAWYLQIAFDFVYILELRIEIVAYKGKSYTNTAADNDT
jgi:hypothetical protein